MQICHEESIASNALQALFAFANNETIDKTIPRTIVCQKLGFIERVLPNCV